MNIRVIGVGKIREKYISEGLDEYLKRLRPMARVDIREVPDERVPEGLSLREEDQVRAREGDRVLRLVRKDQIIVALDIDGEGLSSAQFAEKIRNWGLAGKSEVAFIIGGSLGLHHSVLERADLRLSFGRMTYPHQLMRLILLEQIYRALKINRGEPYHK